MEKHGNRYPDFAHFAQLVKETHNNPYLHPTVNIDAGKRADVRDLAKRTAATHQVVVNKHPDRSATTAPSDQKRCPLHDVNSHCISRNLTGRHAGDIVLSNNTHTFRHCITIRPEETTIPYPSGFRNDDQ